MKKPELLAPVGGLEQLYTAVWYGADAIYLAAKDFGMRTAPANFTFEQLKEGCDFAHQNGVLVYQTVNILPTNSDVEKLEHFLKQSEQAGVDAFIVADIGVMMLSKRICPNMPIHISVQAGVVNYLTANELYNLGASRVVLARELTIEEVETIREKIDENLEIECFVHGAICMSFSGRCLISQYILGRDANKGQCAQPCRWEYEIRDARINQGKQNNSKNDVYMQDAVMEVVEESEIGKNGEIVSTGSYILNSKDLCLIENIDKLSKAGITSFKIEGRAKSSFYVASVIGAYRAAIDSYFDTMEKGEKWNLPSWIYDEVQKISHREYTTGFYFAGADGEDGKNGRYNPSKAPTSLLSKGYKQEYEPLAVCLDDGWHQRGKFMKGDTVDLISPYDKPVNVLVSEIFDEDKNSLESTPHADQKLEFILLEPTTKKPINNIKKGSFLRGRKIFTKL